MSNDVQSHETRVERSAGEERRAGLRHAAASLGSVTARIIGGSQVDLVNFSGRGVLFECDSRLLIGARASVRLTTMDANLIVTGRVVRSRVKGLINGALRYDAALVLDHELALTPSIAAALAPVMSDELDADPLAFESAFDSPVEAYLAESEASLAEVADGARPVVFEPTSHDMTAVEAAPELPPVEFETNAVPELVAEPAAADEPVAFEADADVAFEPADEFVFDDAGEPVFDAAPALSCVDADAQAEAVAAIERAAAEESAVSSMFDATPFVAVVEDVPAPDSMFEVTPPTPVHDASTSSFFDSRPSETYGDGAPLDVPVASLYAETPAADAAATVAAFADTPALADPIADPTAEAGDAIDFETEIAFEPEDAAMFEAAFEDTPVVHAPVVDLPVLVAGDASVAFADHVIADHVIADPVIAEPVTVEAEPVTVEPVTVEPVMVESVMVESTADPVDPDVADMALDESIDLPAVMPEREDRVLLQFAATVPHDLADLRRIAADNQW